MKPKTYKESHPVKFAVHKCTIEVEGYPRFLGLLVEQLKRREATCESCGGHRGADGEVGRKVVQVVPGHRRKIRHYFLGAHNELSRSITQDRYCSDHGGMRKQEKANGIHA